MFCCGNVIPYFFSGNVHSCFCCGNFNPCFVAEMSIHVLLRKCKVGNFVRKREPTVSFTLGKSGNFGTFLSAPSLAARLSDSVGSVSLSGPESWAWEKRESIAGPWRRRMRPRPRPPRRDPIKIGPLSRSKPNQLLLTVHFIRCAGALGHARPNPPTWRTRRDGYFSFSSLLQRG